MYRREWELQWHEGLTRYCNNRNNCHHQVRIKTEMAMKVVMQGTNEVTTNRAGRCHLPVPLVIFFFFNFKNTNGISTSSTIVWPTPRSTPTPTKQWCQADEDNTTAQPQWLHTSEGQWWDQQEPKPDSHDSLGGRVWHTCAAAKEVDTSQQAICLQLHTGMTDIFMDIVVLSYFV